MPPVAPVTTPYKHFASKQALLAAIAARELARQREALAETIQREPSPAAVLREAMHRYVAWALEYPARFKLTFGNWTIDSQELGEAAHDVLTMLVEIVAAAQDAGALPRATPSAWHHCYGRWPTGPPTWPPPDISPRTARATPAPTTSSTTWSTTSRTPRKRVRNNPIQRAPSAARWSPSGPRGPAAAPRGWCRAVRPGSPRTPAAAPRGCSSRRDRRRRAGPCARAGAGYRLSPTLQGRRPGR